ncbi:uncharacterized protein [Amphiura filiformis]|uniref:uncharacterized protein isoform X2 n=1 Tax=Amphiura filiformis TaxID=82378 RepID=UPI003B21B40C
MGKIRISTTIVLLVYIINHGIQNVKANQCAADADCVPDVQCQVTTWECTPVDPLLITPVPGQSKSCCEYLDTCDDEEPVSGWVWSRETVREYMGKSHRNHWIDMYVAQGNDTYIVSQYAGSWSTFTENCTDPCDIQTDQMPTEIYVLEPIRECCAGSRIWPEWYQIALATKDPELNISALTLDAPEERSCLCDVSSICDMETSTCRYTTDFDVGEESNSTLPASVKRYRCTGPLGIECGWGTINTSSIFASGYDVDTARFNVWIDVDSVEGGWAPSLDDVANWITIDFEGEEMWVAGIITQGLALNIEKRVDSFIVEYENASGDIYIVGDANSVFYAGARYHTEVINYFPVPVRAVAITIHIMTPCDAGYIGMRFELLGCGVCYNNTMCGSGGFCLPEGICNYDGLILDTKNYYAGLDLLEVLNGTDAEKKAYDTIVGYLGPLENLTTIVFENVTLNVAKAAILALTNISAEGNRTGGETGALAIQKIETLSVVLGNEECVAFEDLDTPEKIEEAEEIVADVVGLVNLLFASSDGWDLKASIDMGDYDPYTEIGGLSAEAGGSESSTVAPGDRDPLVDVENSITKAEQVELSKAKTATNIIQGVSNMASTVASQKEEEDEPLSIKEDTVEIYAAVEDSTGLEEEGYEYETEENLGAAVSADSDNFNFDGYNGSAKVVISVVVIDTTALRTERKDVPDKIKLGLNQDIGRIASNMISFEMNVNGEPVSTPIKFSLAHEEAASNSKGKAIEEARCCFHDESEKDDFVWSAKGLTAEDKRAKETDCASTHTTTFAVLMYLADIEEVSSYHLDIQNVLTKVCSGLSIFALAAALAILIYLRSSLMSERITIHMTLMSTTLLATLVFMLGADKAENTVLCKVITMILHFLYTAIFSWMLVEGVHLYRQIIMVFDTEKSRIWIYFVLGWGVPIVIVVVAAAVEWDKYGTGGFCFLQFKDHTLWAFIGPIIPVILINLVVLVRVAKVVVMAAKLHDTGDGATDTVNRVKAGLRSSALLLPILGVTWVVGFVQHLAIALAYIFVILNSLQVRGAIQQRIKKARDSSLGGNSTNSTQDSEKQRTSSAIKGRQNKVVPECAIQDVD